MLRREFMAAGVALLAGAGAATPAAGPKLRAIERREGDRWVRVRMAELRVGDRFRMEELPFEYRVTEPPTPSEGPDVCSVMAEPIPGTDPLSRGGAL
jgi:hypothetical protein